MSLKASNSSISVYVPEEYNRAIRERVIRDHDEEASIKTEEVKKSHWRNTLMLSFTSLGAIYGDLGTSPLYVLNSIKYKHNPPNKMDVYGGVSVIFYVFTIIVIFKYICVVLFLGPNNGEGGQVAIYAKIARHLKLGPKGVHIPGAPEVSDMELISRQDTTTSFQTTRSNTSVGKRIDEFKNKPAVLKVVQHFILFCCFIGCSLVMSDGLLTPTTSVLSAIGGIQIAKPSFNNVLAVSEVILIVLFAIQHFGSHKVSFLFAPIILLWLLGLFICGVYNIAKFHPGIFRALSPYYAIKLLRESGIDVFSGAMLAITGTEAMFADIGHFGRLPIQLTLATFVYPCLIICYLGQAAFIVEHPEAWTSPFFNSLPGGHNSWAFWIMFILATLATIIASQALILSVFSIVGQLVNLDCFPNIRIIHVSPHHVGKVYIPAVNWMLMVGVVCTAAGFKNSNNVTAAYGLGITLDFLVTSALIVLCIIYVYNYNVLWAVGYILIFVPLEIIMVVSNMKKVPHGAWFPIMMTAIMYTFLNLWRWARSKKVEHEFRTRVKVETIYPSFGKNETLHLGEPETLDLGQNPPEEVDITQGPPIRSASPSIHSDKSETLMVNSRYGLQPLATHDGIAIMYNDAPMQIMNAPNRVPQVYAKIVATFSSLPSTFIFCSTRTLSIPVVPDDERVLLGAMRIPGHYKCIVRFGFTEKIAIDKDLCDTIVRAVPEARDLSKESDDVPILHIFEHNLVRSHEYSSPEHKTRNPAKMAVRFLRGLVINSLFGPLYSATRHYGQFVRADGEEDELEKKIFVGSVSRI